ncbi:DNA-formamidopyrimidine glycosylase [Enterococcus canintestini]|uniref:Formamidopyrimidine-DNA glycosylase n=1 Tax=Enterococcus canintestini TaxID=317010 RepID=A0A1L8R966_9ENTE|nr:DNA-formamidopyrimidine glycosylase [Enterococcus canintestini]OJG16287.1 formamidopyrimidine-DNA glycosylase [Enterococcus canintestini]
MPELPEVETVRQGLLQLVLKKEIASVDVFWPKIIALPEVETFKRELVGQKIETINRRGKYLIFELSNYELISHLRMEGKYEFFSAEKNAEVTKHTHVIFHFNDGSQLQYRDVRKFGRMELVLKGEAQNFKSIAQLGPEPTPETFKLAAFKENLAKTKREIKPALLDQKMVTGLGNIYVDEALWQAKIHPMQPCDTLTDLEIKQLRLAIIDVLQRAVAAGGTTVRTYLNALGEAGKFQLSLNVYGKTGQPCPRCQTPIEKIKVAQRGTHLCPHCQKLIMR